MQAVARVIEGTRVVTLVLDMNPKFGGINHNPSPEAISAARAAIEKCLEPVPCGLKEPLPERFTDICEVFTHGNGHPQDAAGAANTCDPERSRRLMR